jgi:TolB protein
MLFDVPSPDGSLLGLVLRNKPGEMTLSVTDADGRGSKEIMKGSQIFGVSWSPDGKRLAFADIAQSGTAKGIYFADVSTGQSSALSVDVKFVADPPRWNPSGDRLMVTASSPGEDGGKPAVTTYLVAAE